MTIKARKARMRREVIGRILAMDPTERRTQEQQLVARLPLVPGLASAAAVLMFATAFPEEVDTTAMLRFVLGSGQRLICPRVVEDRRALELCEILNIDRDLVPGPRAIREPASRCRPVEPREVDWVLVPGLAFDGQGNRLGRGGGYYDRLLPTLRADAACWALILDPQWVAEVPREPHDRPLDGVVDHRGHCAGGLSSPVSGA